MKKILFVFTFIFNIHLLLANSSEPFVYTYDAVSLWDNNNEKWSSWKAADIVIAYNYKNTSKVAIFMGKEEPLILTPIMNSVKKEITRDGRRYQSMKYINNKGEEVSLLLFEDGNVILGDEEVIVSFRYSEI